MCPLVYICLWGLGLGPSLGIYIVTQPATYTHYLQHEVPLTLHLMQNDYVYDIYTLIHVQRGCQTV
jgi:hypothetical protein